VNDSIFAMVPIEVLADKRLTLWHIKVLVGLLSFRSKNSDTVWPGRDALAERCGGIHISNISKTTSELCELGWLEKQGSGGNSRSARYKIVVPDLQQMPVDKLSTVAESTTFAKVAESATRDGGTVADSATLRVADSARGIEQTIEHTTKGNRQGARALLAKRGLPKDLADAWMKVRKEKRLAITEPALEGIQREADKAGLTFEQVIRLCCEKGWGGFMAHWDRGESAAGEQQSKQGALPWWSSESGILAKGKEFGMQPVGNESWANFKARINSKIAESAGRVDCIAQ